MVTSSIQQGSLMADATNKPVIFLAFANDRDDSVGYLRNLPDEARRLSDVLQPAEQAGLCEVVVKQNSTAGDIFKVFQDPKYRNRIAIFHYGGHANGYQLLLESPEGKAAAADAGGLAAFLSQQQGLQLVFLNGCSTQQQTRELLDANIAAVISTSRSIDDRVATDFAWQFYQGLAGGANLRNAYLEASAAIKTTKGGNLRALYFGDADQPEDHRNKNGFPWNLYPREGSENADQWNLPEAVGDVLFGLPPLKEEKMPESPYRYLSYFRCEDAEVFFGRGHQIRKLYGLLTTGTQSIILFYGQSGVGKSSLLDAGLMPRLEQSCEVRYLRRRTGGLLDTLQVAFLPEASNVPIETAWLAKEEQLKKPLIVFLDQVEEFYTQPIEDLPDELDQLLRVVKATFNDPKCRPKGKLVLGFRKEWLAELEAQLVAYDLDRAKVPLEPLDRDGIIEVVQGPTRSARLRERYGLKVEKGLAEIIADDMLKDRGSAISTTLQILLSKMWTEANAVNSESPQFSQELYDDLKRRGILLGDFFDQQLEEFKSHLPCAADSGLLLDVLVRHTTDLGSAKECSQERLLEEYAHVSDELPNLLRQCLDLYLLTDPAGTQKKSTKATRLAHDTLAPLVRVRFDKSDRPGQRARRILDNKMVDWKGGQTGTPLDKADLLVVQRGSNGTCAWNTNERRLVEASLNLRAKARRTQKWLKIAGACIVVVIAGLAAFLWIVNRDLKTARNKLQWELAGSHLAMADGFIRDDKGLPEAVHWYWRASQTMLPDDPRRDSSLQKLAWNASFLESPDEINGAVLDVIVAGDGPLAAVIERRGGNEELRVYDVSTALLQAPPCTIGSDAAHNYIVSEFTKLSPDGMWAVTKSPSYKVTLWNLKTSVPKVLGFPHDVELSSSVFAPDSTAIAIPDRDSVLLIPLDRPNERTKLPHREKTVTRVAFTADGTQIISGCKDGSLFLWDVATETQLSSVPPQGGEVTLIECNPSNQTACICVERFDENLQRSPDTRLWDFHDKFAIVNDASVATGSIRRAIFSADGTTLVLATVDTIHFRDATGKELRESIECENPVTHLRVSPDGSTILASSTEGYGVTVVNVSSQEKARELQSSERESFLNVGFDQLGSNIITFSRTHTTIGSNERDDLWIRSWELGSLRQVASYKLTSGPLCEYVDAPGLGTVGISHDGRRGVTNDGILYLTQTGEVLTLLTGEAPIKQAALDSSGHTVATIDLFGSLRIHRIDLTNTAKPTTLKHPEAVVCAELTPDGKQVVTGCEDGRTRVWMLEGDLATVEHVFPCSPEIKPDPPRVSVVAISKDGLHVAWGTGEKNSWESNIPGDVSVWDTLTKKPLNTLKHDGKVSSLTFGRTAGGEPLLFSGGADGVVQHYNIASGATKYMNAGGLVDGLHVDEDGKTLLVSYTLSTQRSLSLWDLLAHKPWGRPLLADYNNETAAIGVDWVTREIVYFSHNGATNELTRCRLPSPPVIEAAALKLLVEVKTGLTVGEDGGLIRLSGEKKWWETYQSLVSASTIVPRVQEAR